MTKLIYKKNIEKFTDQGFTISSDGFTITRYTGTSTEITIPDEIKTIDDEAFYGNKQITKIFFNTGSKLTTIGEEAFSGCTKLTSINIPLNVETIGISAFQSCGSLPSIIIPSNVTDIGSSAFNGCFLLKSINIPFSVSTIGSYTFSFCKALKSINIPQSIKTISNNAFFNCQSLISITIPFSVTIIDSTAFFGCTSLNEIIFEGEIPTINTSAFRNIARNITVKYRDNIDEEKIKANTNEGSIITFIDISKMSTLPNGIKKISDRALSISKEKISVLNSDFDKCIAKIIDYLYPSKVPKYNANQSGKTLYINILNPIEQFYPKIESFESPSEITEVIFKFDSDNDPALKKLENINMASLKKPDYINYILITIIILLIMYIFYMFIFKRVFI